MTTSRRLHISCAATFANVDMIRAAINGICTDFFGLADNAASVTDFSLIVTELLNNAVEHAQAGVIDGEIFLTENEAIFRLISGGESFDPTKTVMMPDVNADELPEGGYGLALIQALADGMEYERREERNMITLRKIFPKKHEEEQGDGD